MHLKGDTRHTTEEMHSISADQEYRGAANTMKAYDQTWFEWLEFTKADGTGIHVTPYTKVYDFLEHLRDRHQAKKKQSNRRQCCSCQREHHEAPQNTRLSHVSA